MLSTRRILLQLQEYKSPELNPASKTNAVNQPNVSGANAFINNTAKDPKDPKNISPELSPSPVTDQKPSTSGG